VASLYRPKVVEYRMPDGSTRDPEGRRVRKDTTGAVRHVTESPTWWGRYRDANGDRQQVPLSESKTKARAMLDELAHDSRLDALGIERPAADPFAAHRKRPLAGHLADFGGALRAKGDTEEHVGRTLTFVRSVLDGCEFSALDDLDTGPVNEWLAALRADRPAAELPAGVDQFTPRQAAALLGLKPLSVTKAVSRHRLAATGAGRKRRYPRATVEALAALQARGGSPETVNHYVRAVRSFCRWLVKNRRLPYNPLETLALVNTASDRRHDRRELTAGELRRLLDATRSSGETFRGLGPADRVALYACACGTGFRAGALASLTPESFDLSGTPPVVVLAARKNKSRKQRTQPLPADVAGLLRSWLAGREKDRPAWPGTWHERGAEMIRADLALAGIPYAVEGPDGPLFADFHALRHSYITALGRGGVDLRTAQELAGHSTPVLTARYSHRRLHDLAGAVDKLPDFLSPAGKAGPVKPASRRRA